MHAHKRPMCVTAFPSAWRMHGQLGRPPRCRVARLRQVPVVERDDRLDARRQQRVDHAAVEGHAGRVDAAVAVGHHARPRHGEAKVLDAVALHDGDVARPLVVEVVGHVGRVDGRVRGRPGVPDAGRAPVLGDGALPRARPGCDAVVTLLTASRCSLFTYGGGSRARGGAPRSAALRSPYPGRRTAAVQAQVAGRSRLHRRRTLAQPRGPAPQPARRQLPARG